MDQHQETMAESARKSIENDNAGLEKPFVDHVTTVDDLTPDIENRGAIKGDDSDGRVNWTTKQVLATLFLSGLYVGRSWI
jgi:hypothetical protein